MKRLIVLCVVFVLVISTVGCKHQENSLTDILSDKISFVNESGDTVHLKEYRSTDYPDLNITPQKYAFVDFDNDGSDELVIYASPEFGLYLVFHRYHEKIYAFEFTERAMINLKQDGTFIQSDSAFINTYAKLIFINNKLNIYEEAYRNDSENIYRINGEVKTFDDIKKYENSFHDKADVEWSYV